MSVEVTNVDSGGLDEPLDLAAQTRMARLRQAMFGVTAGPIRIGRFILLETLGAGGMGIVYAAHDPQLDRRIALKLVKPDVGRTAKDEARLIREAQSMARLSHPNVVQIHEIGVWEERVFIAMELVRGRTLAAWLATPGRSWREIVAIFLEAGRGLAAAHRVGVVHRDFKPENVLCGDDGRVRVTDFGLARGSPTTARDEAPDGPQEVHAGAGLAPATTTTTHTIAGTPAYMAPEVFLGEAATAASDQFSFCVALYQALHGVPPFAGDDRAGLMRAVIAGERQEPPRMRIPRRIHRALVRGLARTPAERFPTMEALLAALEPGLRLRDWIVRSALGLVTLGLVGSAMLLLSRPVCASSITRFDTSNSKQPYRVPSGCSRIHVQVWGAGGGGAMPPGGGGGYAEATLRVEPGRELVVVVGGGGGHWAADGSSSRETGGNMGGHGGYSGASSGGYSGVREGNGWLLVAGGGGGAGATGVGGGGGGERGEDGRSYNVSQGLGGTQEGPGAGGRSFHGADPGSDGNAMNGGVGGAFRDYIPGDPHSGVGGGAGGGGYFGGGGGGGDSWSATEGGRGGGGGGGSGYIDFDRALPDAILLAASGQETPRAMEAGGAGRGGDGRQPPGGWGDKKVREATSGASGLVIITTGSPPP